MMNAENKTESEPNDTTTTTKKSSVPNVCCGIYGLKNKTNGKWYVGQSVDIIERWNHDYKRVKCHTQPKIYNALKKYGYDNFEKVILEECDNVDWILDYREMYWIRVLNSVKTGYNVSFGGQSNGRRGVKCSTKMKKLLSRASKKQWERQRSNKDFLDTLTQRLSQSQKVAWKSSVSRENHSRSMANVWKTDEHRKTMLKSYLKKPKHRFVRDDGKIFVGTRYEFLTAFPNLHNGCVSSLLTGNRKSHRGWAVAERFIPELGDDSRK